MSRGLMLAGVVVGLDLATKALVETHLTQPMELVAGAKLALGHNSGVAFGAFSGLPTWAVVTGLVVVVSALGTLAVRSGVRVSWVAAGLLGGGAAANLVDRIGDGRVTDFIDLPRWPAFNLADIAITAAAALLLLTVARPELPADAAQAPATPPAERTSRGWHTIVAGPRSMAPADRPTKAQLATRGHAGSARGGSD